MLIRIDLATATPLHEQISVQLRLAINEGALRPGDKLTGARELAQSLDINMHTVLRAYAILRDEGLIELRRGRGARVLAQTATPPEIADLLKRLLQAARRHNISTEQLTRALVTRKDFQ